MTIRTCRSCRLYNFCFLVMRCSFWLIVAILSVLTSIFTTSLSHAQEGYPQRTDLYINDYANLLTAEDAANVRALFTDLNRDTNIEVAVVTIGSINDYNTGDETIESFATALFNAWGIGDGERNDGVLILVAIKDRDVRIEVGSGYGSSQNENMQEVINEHILPSFRRDSYSQGIYRGARAVAGKLTGNWPEDLSQVASSTSNSSNQESEVIGPNPSVIRTAGPDYYPFVCTGTLLAVGLSSFLVLRWVGPREKTRSRSRSAKRRNMIRGILIGVSSFVVFANCISTFFWLGGAEGPSNLYIRIAYFAPLGALLGGLAALVNGGKSSSRDRDNDGWSSSNGDSSSGGSSGGGHSSGGGASGKW